jgi:hypothetical protein
MDVIVQAIKNDDLAKFRAELETLLTTKADPTVTNVTTVTSVTAKTVTTLTPNIVTSKTVTAKTVTTVTTVISKTITDLIEMTLDEYGNNLWTLAAENGTEKIMNFLLNDIENWPRKDLECILHFWTHHKERSCMNIVKRHKPVVIAFSYTDFKFEKLKNHLNINTFNPSQLRDYLKKLKQHLDTTINSLDYTIRKMKRWDSERKTPNQLRGTLEDLRKGLLLNDLQWHHSSLTGIVSQCYPPDNIIVQKIIKLEIKCHTQTQLKATLDENHIENGGIEVIKLAVVTSEENENKPTGTFISCIYKRVGKSPCTLEALKMASQTSTSIPKQNLISSFYSRMMKRHPFLICLSLFIFSFGLFVFDISTDVKLVWELYQLNILPEKEKWGTKSDFSYLVFNAARHVSAQNENFDVTNALFLLTCLAVILPMAGYFVSWLTADNDLGFGRLKKKVH